MGVDSETGQWQNQIPLERANSSLRIEPTCVPLTFTSSVCRGVRRECDSMCVVRQKPRSSSTPSRLHSKWYVPTMKDAGKSCSTIMLTAGMATEPKDWWVCMVTAWWAWLPTQSGPTRHCLIVFITLSPRFRAELLNYTHSVPAIFRPFFSLSLEKMCWEWLTLKSISCKSLECLLCIKYDIQQQMNHQINNGVFLQWKQWNYHPRVGISLCLAALDKMSPETQSHHSLVRRITDIQAHVHIQGQLPCDMSVVWITKVANCSINSLGHGSPSSIINMGFGRGSVEVRDWQVWKKWHLSRNLIKCLFVQNKLVIMFWFFCFDITNSVR